MPFDRPSHPAEPDNPRESDRPEPARMDDGINRLLNRTDEERQADWDAHAKEISEYRAANPRRTLERPSNAETVQERDETRRSDSESDQIRDDRPRTSEMVDDNGLNPAEYIAAWNKKVASERPRPDVDLRDDNGMTAAELRFQRNKQIEEAEAKAKAAEADENAPPRKSVVTDAQGRTGAEIRFQGAKRAEEEAKADADSVQEADKPEGRLFKTVTEELGESKTWRSFDAAKREIRARLGYEQGIQVDHIVEQCQGKSERSGFATEQINSSDNMARLDKDLHLEKSKLYSRIPFGSDRTLRNMLNGMPWEAQLEIGCDAIDQEMRRRRDQHDGE